MLRAPDLCLADENNVGKRRYGISRMLEEICRSFGFQ